MTRAPHPGYYLNELLRQHSITANFAAVRVAANRLWFIARGRKRVSGDTALRLAKFFGNTPEEWLKWQYEHELSLAREKLGSKIKHVQRLADTERAHG
jgi:antitoxin HigA-1